MIDDGVKISISSRALGSVRENKTVAIDRLITYDLVAEPGFANAGLTRVNESLGILNENLNVYKLPLNENVEVEKEDSTSSKEPTPETCAILISFSLGYSFCFLYNRWTKA